MTCSVPGCPNAPAEVEERVKASRTTELSHLRPRREMPLPPGVALTHLCPTHRAEFEKLGWLASAEEVDEDA